MAAGGTTSNVQLGPGRLWVAPLATAEPASASATLDGAYRAIGYTEEGSAFSTELTNSEVEVAEEVDPILYVLSKRANTLALTMAEVTRRNLALALGAGAAAANDATALEPPEPGTELAVMIVWDSDETATAANTRWLFRQCKSGGTISIPRRKAPQKALLAVTFNLEKPVGLAPFKVWPDSGGRV